MRDLLEQAESLQNLLVAHATGGVQDAGDDVRLRQVLLAQPAIESCVPQFVRTCRDLSQFWEFIKRKFARYITTRSGTFLWEEFLGLLLEFLERGGAFPTDMSVASALERLDTAHVQAVWSASSRSA